MERSATTSAKDLVRTYLLEIGSVPMLEREQEIRYGQMVQQMMQKLQAKESLTQQLNRTPTFEEWADYTHLSTAELNKTLRSGEWARQRMVKANLRLVVVIAKQYQNRGLELLDLIQEGTLGLIRGIEKFDPSRGYKLSTYCWHWCKQAITRAIANKSRSIRLPVQFGERLNKLKKVQRQLSQTLGRTPTVEEVAAEIELTPEQVRCLWQRSRQPFSLDVCVGEDKDTSLSELLEMCSQAPTAYDYVLDCERRETVAQMLIELTEQQQRVISLCFGLEDGVSRSLAEIGRELNITREGVRHIKLKALENLRKSDRAGTLAQLLN